MPDTTPTPTPVPVTSPMQFAASLHFIFNRGRAPVSFLTEIVTWGKKTMAATPEIFAANDNTKDAYAAIKPYLGLATPGGFGWIDSTHRVAAILELARVHAGLESSWNWLEGVDTTNAQSMASKSSEETGIFQVSYDSQFLDGPDGKNVLEAFAQANGLDTPEKFIAAMKENHELAMEYYVRLVRVSIAWAGPLMRKGSDSVYPYLYKDSMLEFMHLLK